MKRFLNYCLSLTLLACLFLVTSCGKDPVEPVFAAPAVSLGGEDAEQDVFEVGEEVSLLFTFTAPAQISSFNYTVTINGTATPKTFVNPQDISGISDTDVEGSIPFLFEIPATMEGAVVNILFEVVDKKNEMATAEYDFVVETNVDSYSAVLLGGQYHATEESFYNAVENAEYKYAAAKDNANKVDFLYYYGTSGDNPVLNTLAAPTNERAKTAFNAVGLPLPASMDNNTVFKKLPAGTKFDDVKTSNGLKTTFTEAGGTAQNIVSNLAVGEIVAFQLDTDRGSRYGLIHVTQVSAPSDTRETRAIKIDVKIQN